MDIPFYYDPMIAKLICHADSREAAIEKMIRAIDEYEITGLETTLGFCRFVMQHKAFRSGNFDTRFVENYFKPAAMPLPDNDHEALIAALLSVNLVENAKAARNTAVEKRQVSLWKKNRL
jgi:acetyl-CoA carboxylase biotin carboxylase subunit